MGFHFSFQFFNVFFNTATPIENIAFRFVSFRFVVSLVRFVSDFRNTHNKQFINDPCLTQE